MASKAIKLIAKYNTLKLAAKALENHCGSHAFEELEGLPSELLEQIDVEFKSLVK